MSLGKLFCKISTNFKVFFFRVLTLWFPNLLTTVAPPTTTSTTTEASTTTSSSTESTTIQRVIFNDYITESPSASSIEFANEDENLVYKKYGIN